MRLTVFTYTEGRGAGRNCRKRSHSWSFVLKSLASSITSSGDRLMRLVPSDRAVVVVYLLIAAWTAVEPQFGFEQRLPGAPEPSQSSFRRCEQSRASRRPETAAQPASLRPASRPTHPPGWSEPGARSYQRAPCSTASTSHA